ncbi:MAG: 3',5'-nucleoside bisphosphate phosphatase [Burkholderiaceae bacterium]
MFSLRKRADPAPLNADLHCHSTVSDGTLAPIELAQRAHAKGVQLWALTDHDELGGLKAAAATAEALGLPFVAGVEISVSWSHETLHIVGLRIDPDNEVLRNGLEQTRSGRTRRAHAMAAQLAQAGIPGAFEGALNYVGNPDLIGRTHFARYIVEINRCDDVHEVFTKYLVAGKPGYVPMQWATLAEAVGWIHAAGGVAVIAHPGRYKLREAELRELFAEFKALGGEAIEVVTGSHSNDQFRRFAGFAKEYGFLASRGSDFHGPEESRFDLGTLPPLPDSVVPVWHDW